MNNSWDVINYWDSFYFFSWHSKTVNSIYLYIHIILCVYDFYIGIYTYDVVYFIIPSEMYRASFRKPFRKKNKIIIIYVSKHTIIIIIIQSHIIHIYIVVRRVFYLLSFYCYRSRRRIMLCIYSSPRRRRRR